MFTGIVETHSPVLSISEDTLIIARPKIFENLTIGQSISTNGACLSVAEYDEENISFRVLSETWRKTNLSKSKTVNLERAMKADGRFEGHILLGHVDTVISLLEIKEEISGKEYIFEIPPEKKYLVSKGSIGLNGVSLTIGNITENTFSVFLIPLTLEHSNIGNLLVHEKVTIEYDYIAKLLLQKG